MSRCAWSEEDVRNILDDDDAPLSLKVFAIMYQHIWSDVTRVALIELIGQPIGLRPWNVGTVEQEIFGNIFLWFPPHIFGTLNDVLNPNNVMYVELLEWRKCYDLLFEQLFEENLICVRKSETDGLGLYCNLNNQSMEFDIIPKLKGLSFLHYLIFKNYFHKIYS